MLNNYIPQSNRGHSSNVEAHNHNPLYEFLDEEWNSVDALKEELRFDKILIKKAFEYLHAEKVKLR